MLKTILFGRHEDVLGINRRNLEFVYPNNARKYFNLVDEKLKTKEIFKEAGVTYPETLLVFDNFRQIMDFDSKLKGLNNFVIKPNRGRGGHGILVLGEESTNGFLNVHAKEVSLKQIRRHTADILLGVYSHGMNDLAIFEERIVPAQFLNDLYPRGLADIRIIYYHKQLVMGMIRVPTSLSNGKANLHQGGIGVGFDLESGVTTHASFKGKKVSHHPDTHAPLLGIQLPDVELLKEICIKIANKLPLNYLGFDLTLDENRGPLIIEVNARPGLEIQNVNQKGLLPILRQIQQNELEKH